MNAPRRPSAPTKQLRQRAAAVQRSAYSNQPTAPNRWAGLDAGRIVASLAVLVAITGVWLAPERPDPSTVDPGNPDIVSVPVTPESGQAQSFCAAWNEWVAARSVYLEGGDAQPAVDTARALLQRGQRLALAPTDRAGFQFLLEEFTGPSPLTDPDVAVDHRNAQSFVAWLTNTCI